MSLILDALRKSERTRQQTLSGRVSAAGASLGRGRVPVPWATLIGLLLIANVIVLGVIFWRSRAPAPLPPAPATVSAKPAASVPATVYRPAVRSLAAEAAAVAPSAATAVAHPVSSALAARSAVPATHAQVSALGATPVNVSQAPATAPTDTVDAAVPPLDSLPSAFQQSFPPLHLEVHGYFTNPAERFAVINMHRYTKGETLAEGPSVVAIVADGVILEFHGQKFLLPRQ